MNIIRKAIVSGLGTGYLPAGGTWASLIIVAVYCALIGPMLAASGSTGGPCAIGTANIVMAAALVLSSVACVALGRFAEQAFGCKDPSQCTIDEWAGQSLALLFVPLPADVGLWWVTPLTAFVAFRFFDILKPPPVRQMEKLPAGWGVLMDDLAAGVYANIAAQLVLRLGFGS